MAKTRFMPAAIFSSFYPVCESFSLTLNHSTTVVEKLVKR